MGLFNGQLAQNSTLTTLFNMILDMSVLTDNFSGDLMYTKGARKAGQYGDRELFISSNPQSVQTWEGHEAESAKLLATNYNKQLKEEEVVIDQKFMAFTTTDNYESKKAFLGEGAFSSYIALVKDFVSTSKEIHSELTYRCALGTVSKTSQAVYEVEIEEVAGEDFSTTIAKEVAKLIKKMNNYTTDYNSFGYLRRYNPADIKITFNEDYVTDAKYVNLPSIFNNEPLKKIFTDIDNEMNAMYFGNVNASATYGNGTTVRSLIEQDITTGGTTTHYKPGDLIKSTDQAPAGTSYTTDANIIGKVYIKPLIYLQGWTASETFHNSRGLTDTQFLVWTESKPTALDAYPYITLKKKTS